MKKTSLLLSLLLLLWSGATQAQVSGNARYNDTDNYPHETAVALGTAFDSDSSMLITARVLINVPAQSYVVALGMAQQAPTVEQCQTLMAARTNALAAALQKIGLDKSAYYLDFVSQVPTYEYDVDKKIFSRTLNEVPKGFELKQNIHIAYQHPEQLAQIAQAAATQEIYDLIKVDYIPPPLESLYDTLRQHASRILTKKANMCRTLGIRIDQAKYQLLSENYRSTYPAERYQHYTAYSSSTPNLYRKDQVTQATKATTQYYEPLPYNSLDLVLQPSVVEPVVQLTYVESIRYFFNKK